MEMNFKFVTPREIEVAAECGLSWEWLVAEEKQRAEEHRRRCEIQDTLTAKWGKDIKAKGFRLDECLVIDDIGNHVCGLQAWDKYNGNVEAIMEYFCE